MHINLVTVKRTTHDQKMFSVGAAAACTVRRWVTPSVLGCSNLFRQTKKEPNKTGACLYSHQK